jgi:hypothetical protein
MTRCSGIVRSATRLREMANERHYFQGLHRLHLDGSGYYHLDAHRDLIC